MNLVPQTLRPQGRDRVHHVEDGLSGSTIPIAFGSPPQGRVNPVTMESVVNGQLANFRHMVGIHSTKGFSGTADPRHNNLHFEGRAAPNVGIYNRVCHREAAAKRGFKFASLLINGCLGLQVIVAAALTAMGAANTNHVSITAFGAINTVIAGILTYLKGSGLPNRIRWAENEWKKVREYIEQRERDFSRPNCQLDVQHVIQVIEAMYEEVKADIANNTPDAYVSLSDLRNRDQPQNPQVPNIKSLMQGAHNQGQNELQEAKLKYGHKATDFLENLIHKEEEWLKKLEGQLAATRGRVVEVGRDTMQNGRDWKEGFEEKAINATEREVEHVRGDLKQRRSDVERSITATTANALRTGQDWERDMEKQGLQAAEGKIEHARGNINEERRDFDRGVHAARDDVAQVGLGVSQEVDAQVGRIAEAQRDIQREAQRARETAAQAQESVQSAAAGFRGFADSIVRIGKVVHDELPQQKCSS